MQARENEKSHFDGAKRMWRIECCCKKRHYTHRANWKIRRLTDLKAPTMGHIKKWACTNIRASYQVLSKFSAFLEITLAVYLFLDLILDILYVSRTPCK